MCLGSGNAPESVASQTCQLCQPAPEFCFRRCGRQLVFPAVHPDFDSLLGLVGHIDLAGRISPTTPPQAPASGHALPSAQRLFVPCARETLRKALAVNGSSPSFFPVLVSEAIRPREVRLVGELKRLIAILFSL